MGHKELLDTALDVMTILHERMVPNADLEAVVDQASVRNFVDAHARLLYDRNQLSSSEAGAAPVEHAAGVRVAMTEQDKRYALAAGIVIAIHRALEMATPAEILAEDSPILDAIREFMEMIAETPNVK